MKYIKNNKQYKDSTLNEGIFSKLFKKYKSKLDVKLSQMLGGSAKEVDEVMSKYRVALEGLLTEKSKKLKAVIELGLSAENGEDVKEDLDNAKKANDESDKIYEQKKELLKEKFDLEFNEIVKSEDNDNIKYYIKLEKIKLQEDLLEFEMGLINDKMGFDKKDIKSSKMLQSLLKNRSERMSNLQDNKKEIEKSLKEESDGKSDDKPTTYSKGDKVFYKTKEGEESENPGTIIEVDEDKKEYVINWGEDENGKAKITTKNFDQIIRKADSDDDKGEKVEKGEVDNGEVDKENQQSEEK